MESDDEIFFDCRFDGMVDASGRRGGVNSDRFNLEKMDQERLKCKSWEEVNRTL